MIVREATPNDEPTLRAVERVARRHRRMHMSVCPHPGPTSKGDCLNWTYRRMQEYEAHHGIRFRIIMTHDAEDVVHPDSLQMINWYSRDHAMVQIPVLPLATGAAEFTHGIYCDEFAEYQTKDIPVRQRLGGFLASVAERGFRPTAEAFQLAGILGRPVEVVLAAIANVLAPAGATRITDLDVRKSGAIFQTRTQPRAPMTR